ncbi:MAG: hypothetical protein QW228_03490 [Candidatus Aenigmatarchaeota archaeon]
MSVKEIKDLKYQVDEFEGNKMFTCVFTANNAQYTFHIAKNAANRYVLCIFIENRNGKNKMLWNSSNHDEINNLLDETGGKEDIFATVDFLAKKYIR